MTKLSRTASIRSARPLSSRGSTSNGSDAIQRMSTRSLIRRKKSQGKKTSVRDLLNRASVRNLNRASTRSLMKQQLKRGSSKNLMKASDTTSTDQKRREMRGQLGRQLLKQMYCPYTGKKLEGGDDGTQEGAADATIDTFDEDDDSASTSSASSSGSDEFDRYASRKPHRSMNNNSPRRDFKASLFEFDAPDNRCAAQLKRDKEEAAAIMRAHHREVELAEKQQQEEYERQKRAHKKKMAKRRKQKREKLEREKEEARRAAEEREIAVEREAERIRRREVEDDERARSARAAAAQAWKKNTQKKSKIRRGDDFDTEGRENFEEPAHTIRRQTSSHETQGGTALVVCSACRKKTTVSVEEAKRRGASVMCRHCGETIKLEYSGGRVHATSQSVRWEHRMRRNSEPQLEEESIMQVACNRCETPFRVAVAHDEFEKGPGGKSLCFMEVRCPNRKCRRLHNFTFAANQRSGKVELQTRQTANKMSIAGRKSLKNWG